MIKDLIYRKSNGNIFMRVVAGVGLYAMNILLVLDFLAATVIGGDPRLSVSALLGIRLHKNMDHPVLSRLPMWFRDHILQSASWWGYTYPQVNRSIWT